MTAMQLGGGFGLSADSDIDEALAGPAGRRYWGAHPKDEYRHQSACNRFRETSATPQAIIRLVA
jgi:hypothetical protein